MDTLSIYPVLSVSVLPCTLSTVYILSSVSVLPCTLSIYTVLSVSVLLCTLNISFHVCLCSDLPGSEGLFGPDADPRPPGAGQRHGPPPAPLPSAEWVAPLPGTSRGAVPQEDVTLLMHICPCRDTFTPPKEHFAPVETHLPLLRSICPC